MKTGRNIAYNFYDLLQKLIESRQFWKDNVWTAHPSIPAILFVCSCYHCNCIWISRYMLILLGEFASCQVCWIFFLFGAIVRTNTPTYSSHTYHTLHIHIRLNLLSILSVCALCRCVYYMPNMCAHMFTYTRTKKNTTAQKRHYRAKRKTRYSHYIIYTFFGGPIFNAEQHHRKRERSYVDTYGVFV